jgi:site-specific recombinase XerD
MTAHAAGDVYSLTPTNLRQFLLDLGKTHNPGGVHGVYRSVKAFLRWWEAETEPTDWHNPMLKVQAPKRPQELLEPVSLEDLRALLDTCEHKDHAGDRDRAIVMALLDTGCRAAEFVSLNFGDVTMSTGAVMVRRGKGGKGRAVFMGAKTRRALTAYLRYRPDLKDPDPLWATLQGGRLTHAGIREILRRRAQRAGIAEPSLHSFRRAFALSSLRNGVDVYALQRLMGHSDLSVLRRYLAQTEGDLQRAHEKGGPVDHLL